MRAPEDEIVEYVNKQTCLIFKMLPKKLRRCSQEHLVGSFNRLRDDIKVL